MPAQPDLRRRAAPPGPRPGPLGPGRLRRRGPAGHAGGAALAGAGRPRLQAPLRRRPARDAAYHQGTVWPWLIGPFVDAWLRVHPGDFAGARRFLEGFRPTLREFGLGTIGEIFDAEPPYAPRGCIAQAWSVAEVLRAWARTSQPGQATGRVDAWRRPAT